MNDPILGIDLGTTYSLCAVFEHGKPTLVPNIHKTPLTPSVVALIGGGIMLAGHSARELRTIKPDACASQFKRLMGMNQSIHLMDRVFSAPELSALVLKSLRKDAQEYLGRECRKAVITVPAYFNDNQRAATMLAGRLAGLEVLRIINEPTAAALTYGFHQRESEQHLLVFDLGGGTFDVTLMEIFDGNLEIVATAGISMLGGDDFNEAILDWVLGKSSMKSISLTLRQRACLLRECEQAKHDLSTKDQAQIRIPNKEGGFGEERSQLLLSRSDFAAIAEPLLQRMLPPIQKVLRDAEMKVEELNACILVGGATRMPALRDFLSRAIDVQQLSSYNPDEVVALGAAIQGALIQDLKAVEDIVMTDVCPFTLGVEIVKVLGGRMNDGYFLPIIHRNTTIPVSKEEAVYPSEPGQTRVNVRVFQGESRRCEDNLYLGNLEVSGIPAYGENRIYIRFTYDLNGILEVEAQISATGKTHQVVLTRNVTGLSEKEVRQSLKKMQQYKFFPREEEVHHRLLYFAGNVVGELSPSIRSNFERLIDQYEAALNAGDKKPFMAMREQLISTLSTLGFPFHWKGGSE